MYLVREAKNKVFSVDAKGGIEKNPKNLEEAKKLGLLVARTLCLLVSGCYFATLY